jgi:hypothetical protein
MSEIEHEEHEHEVPRRVQAGIEERRGGGASLDAGVRERLAPGLGDPLSDVRVHTDTGAGTLARAVSARAFATGRDVFFAHGEYRPGTTDGDRLLAHELAHVVQQRGAPASGVMRLSQPGDAHEREADTMAATAMTAAAAPEAVRAGGEALVARDFIDDVKNWWNSPDEAAKKVEREEAVTKQDWDQVLSLVSMPVNVARYQVSGEPDVAKAKMAAARVGPAREAMLIIANSKKDPKNRDHLQAPATAIAMLETTLKVMAEPDKAKDIWKEHFEAALQRIDEVLALPIRDESQPQEQGQGQPAADPDATLTQRDHDLITATLKRPLQELIRTTGGEPYKDWDPKAVGADPTLVGAAGGFSNRKLITVRVRIQAGIQAIKTFAMSMNDQQKEAVAKFDEADMAIARALEPYVNKVTAEMFPPTTAGGEPAAQP